MDIVMTTLWMVLALMGCAYTARQILLASADRES